jgi:hypothetical protein
MQPDNSDWGKNSRLLHRKPPALRDNGIVKEIFADGVAGVLFHNGNFHLTLTTLRADHGSGDPRSDGIQLAILADGQ